MALSDALLVLTALLVIAVQALWKFWAKDRKTRQVVQDRQGWVERLAEAPEDLPAPRSVASELVTPCDPEVPLRRGLSETLRAAAQAAQEPREQLFDELLEHLEQSRVQVELRQHAVLLKRSELHLLSLLGSLRDLLMRSLQLPRRPRLAQLVSCTRSARLRALLDSLELSHVDDRLSGCRDACDAVEAVLKDLGLQEALRHAQAEKRLALQLTLERRRQDAEQEALELQRLQGQREVMEMEEAVEEQELELCAGPDFAPGDPSMLNWFLDFAEALLSEVLCFLDGLSLTYLELCSSWGRRLVTTSLPGVWRFVHLSGLKARCPAALARAPRNVDLRGGGPWKQLWLARRHLLAEPDTEQRRVAFEQARLLLNPGSHAVVQPMKPQDRFMQSVMQSCMPSGFQQDPRFGPLQERWCSHLLLGAEAAITQENGVQTDYEELYMSWSVCFSAHQGLPRLFLASARGTQELWEVSLAECRLPAKAPLPWAAAAQEVYELRAARQALQQGLCDAKELCSFKFQGPGWLARNAQLAPAEHWQHLQKEIFGELRGSATRTCLQLLLALTCPKPFAEEPEKLSQALRGLGALMED